MALYMQTQRFLQIQTSLGPDAILLARMEGEEAISRPFRFQLELASPSMDVDASALLRTPAVVSFPLHDGSPRIIHGLFNRFSQTGKHEDLATYRAELVAWPWFLSFRRNTRVFQQKSILDIAEEIFRFWGFTDFEVRCDDRPTRDYVAQYNETDLDFVSRWLETEGIFYYFEHSPDGHVLILADNNSALQPCASIAEAWLLGQTVQDRDVISSLTREHAVQVGRVTVRDYDYLQPSFSLEASLEGDGAGESYDHPPASFTSPDDGERYARYGLEAGEARREQVQGEGDCRWMMSGHSFQLLGHFNPATNGEYVVTSVEHRISAGGFRSGNHVEIEYQNAFRCIPSSVPYRPGRLTPRPVVTGVQTAVVVGPEGEEVWTDELGRVKIQFHWDREGSLDADSSCWVRVATPWAGKGYGSISIPRIGNEVLVDFLEGDPDRPIVVGSVYNAEQMPPFALPADDLRMGIKSRSSPGGGGYNEISMTDTKGDEAVTIHAQHNMSTTVENDQTVTINNGNRSLTVKSGTLTDTVKSDASLTVQAGSRTVTVEGGDYSTTASEAISLHGKGKGVSVTGDTEGVTITGNGKGVGITGNDDGVTIIGNADGVDITGNDKGVGIVGNAEGVHITGNGNGVHIEGNDDGVVITGEPHFFAEGTENTGIKSKVVDIGDKEVNIIGTKITIAAGSSTIVLDEGGITIEGPLVRIN